MSDPAVSANYGIIGAVTSKAVAVGPDARAIVNEYATLSRTDFDGAMDDLRAQIAALKLPESHQQLLHEDLSKIEQLAGAKPEAKPAAANVLKSLLANFKLAGEFLQTAAGLQGPIKLIAQWFNVPLPF
ncbi:MAG: hypothetical protein ABR905_06960 [Terracidiphilus sp.]|jgi:hypothetical protein